MDDKLIEEKPSFKDLVTMKFNDEPRHTAQCHEHGLLSLYWCLPQPQPDHDIKTVSLLMTEKCQIFMLLYKYMQLSKVL